MRAFSIVAVAAAVAVLSGCGIFGRSGEVPEGDAWRTDVVTAIAQTPGVLSSENVRVRDVDAGLGGNSPVLLGDVEVEAADPQGAVDAMLTSASEVLGPDSNKVGIRLRITSGDQQALKLADFGYAGVNEGSQLWEATH